MTRKMIAVSADTYDKLKAQADTIHLPIGAFVNLLANEYRGVKVEWENNAETPKAQEFSPASLGIRHS